VEDWEDEAVEVEGSSLRPGGSLETSIHSSGDEEVEAPVSNAGGSGVGFCAASAGTGRGGFFLGFTKTKNTDIKGKERS